MTISTGSDPLDDLLAAAHWRHGRPAGAIPHPDMMGPGWSRRAQACQYVEAPLGDGTDADDTCIHCVIILAADIAATPDRIYFDNDGRQATGRWVIGYLAGEWAHHPAHVFLRRLAESL